MERAICRLVGSRPKIVSLEPNSLADIWTGVEEVARALGVSANTAASRYRYGLDKLRDRLRPLYDEIK